ncbi:MAG: YqgE/AlgH family protein [Pseudohongiellaceae bacterium]|nr:YqgE/AlgH family protein [Pseudohongiellaceae bacterium]
MTPNAESSSLENQFLIAMPMLRDPWFAGSVSYIWQHSADGALGIVINKPSRMKLVELFEELNIDTSTQKNNAAMLSKLVLSGGPVEKNKGFILHESGREWEYTIPAGNGISITMSKDILEDIALNKGPEQYLVALGCAGWDAGQLESEIAQNAWLNAPAQKELMFSDEHEKKAEAAAATLGISLSQLSSFAGHS